MGLQLCTPVGSEAIAMQRFLIASCLAVASLASPDADPALVYGHGAALVGPSGLSGAWPSVYGPGVQSTCYGCRPYGLHVYGKRSADADPALVYGHGLVYGHPLVYPGIAYHGGHATSFVARSPQGLRGKRSADADADADPFYGYGYGHVFPGYVYGHSGYGLSQIHPSGHSFQHVSRLQKREAHDNHGHDHNGHNHGGHNHSGHNHGGHNHGQDMTAILTRVKH